MKGSSLTVVDFAVDFVLPSALFFRLQIGFTVSFDLFVLVVSFFLVFVYFFTVPCTTEKFLQSMFLCSLLRRKSFSWPFQELANCKQWNCYKSSVSTLVQTKELFSSCGKIVKCRDSCLRVFFQYNKSR